MTGEIVDGDNRVLMPTAEFEQAQHLGTYAYPPVMERSNYKYCRLLKASCMYLKMAELRTAEEDDKIRASERVRFKAECVKAIKKLKDAPCHTVVYDEPHYHADKIDKTEAIDIIKNLGE